MIDKWFRRGLAQSLSSCGYGRGLESAVSRRVFLTNLNCKSMRILTCWTFDSLELPVLDLLMKKSLFLSSILSNFSIHFKNYWTDTRHVCTYLNAFSMVIPNIVMKFNNFDIYWKLCVILDLSSGKYYECCHWHKCVIYLVVCWLFCSLICIELLCVWSIYILLHFCYRELLVWI